MTVDSNTAREALEAFFYFEAGPAAQDQALFDRALAAVARLEAENARLREALTEAEYEMAEVRIVLNEELDDFGWSDFDKALAGVREALGLEGSE